MASIRKYETEDGETRYAVRWRDSAGRSRWRSVPGPKKNAEKVRRDLENRQALGPLYEAPPERLGTYLEAWLDRYEQRVRESTLRRREEALRCLVDAKRDPFGFADLYVEQLSAAAVEDAVAAVAARAPRQAQLALQTLKLALANARERGQLVDLAILRLSPPAYVEREPRFLTWPEVEELASWMRDDMRRIVLVAALTGAREGELFALRDVDLELDEGTMLVRASASRGKRGRTKTAASRRSVDLPPSASLLLREQLLARPHTELGLVFPAPLGGHWQRHNFMGTVFRPARKRAGLDEVTFHDLRHTCASLMIAAGCNVKEIAEQLGHTDGGALVLRRYGHLYAGARKGAALALDRHVQGERAKALEASP